MARISRTGDVRPEIEAALRSMNWEARMAEARKRRAAVLAARRAVGPAVPADPAPLVLRAEDRTRTVPAAAPAARRGIPVSAVLSLIALGGLAAAAALARGPGIWRSGEIAPFAAAPEPSLAPPPVMSSARFAPEALVPRPEIAGPAAMNRPGDAAPALPAIQSQPPASEREPAPAVLSVGFEAGPPPPAVDGPAPLSAIERVVSKRAPARPEAPRTAVPFGGPASAAAPVIAAAPAGGAAGSLDQPIAAAAPVSVWLFVPNRLSDTEAARGEAWIAAADMALEASSALDFPIGEDHVRFYHEADRGPAERLAATFGGGVRDFTTAERKPAEGRIELWLSGRGRGAPEPPFRGVRMLGADAPERRNVIIRVERVIEDLLNWGAQR